MLAALTFNDQATTFEIDDSRLAGFWAGPPAVSDLQFAQLLREALEHPIGLPPLREAVVPGDRVALPLDADVPGSSEILRQIVFLLDEAGIERRDIAVLLTHPHPDPSLLDWPEGLRVEVPDLSDRSTIAYLASTKNGRRIYLHRAVTDADFVLPIGSIRYQPGESTRGPWSTLFPGMADLETAQSLRSSFIETYRARHASIPQAPQEEAGEVSWLLGCLYHLAVIPAADGAADLLLGLEQNVRTEGLNRLARLWTFPSEGDADVLIAAVGGPGRPAGLDDLARGIHCALSLSRPGASLILLSQAFGTPGPALRRLANLDDPSDALSALKGAEAEADYPVARSFAQALVNGPVYLYSSLDDNTVEELGIIPLARPAEANRLLNRGKRCLVINQADRTRVDRIEQDDL